MNREEEMMLREYAAGRACTQAVVDVLGPMSLWSKSAFEAELAKARAEERKACDEYYRAMSERRDFELRTLRERFDQMMANFVQSQINPPVKLMAYGESFEAGLHRREHVVPVPAATIWLAELEVHIDRGRILGREMQPAGQAKL